MKKIALLNLVAPLLIVPMTSFAAMKGTGEMPLSVAGGISTPSFVTSVFQNPAGMTTIPKLNMGAQGMWDSSFQNPSYSGAVMYGAETWGIEGGVTMIPGTSTTSTSAFFGLGVGITSLHTSVGVSGAMGLSPSGTSNFNAGILLNPMDKIRFGITAMNLGGGVSEWGAGLSFLASQGLTLVFDATANSGLNVLNFKPGILVGEQHVGITASYGFGNGGSTQITSGFTAGGYWNITDRVHWELYYGVYSTYYTSLTFRLG